MEQILVTSESLKKAQGRFGRAEVQRALETLATTKARLKEKCSVKNLLSALVLLTAGGHQSKENARLIQIAEILFEGSGWYEEESQALLAKINGISEPATVPRQTPEAGVIPKGGKNGKS